MRTTIAVFVLLCPALALPAHDPGKCQAKNTSTLLAQDLSRPPNQVINGPSPKLIRTLTAPGFRYSKALWAIADNRKDILTSTSDGVIAWDITTGKQKQQLLEGWAGALKRSKAGDFFAVARLGAIEVYDLPAVKKRFGIKTGRLANNTLALSHDGSTLAFTHDKAQIDLCNTTTGEIVARLVGHTDIVLRFAFHPDGKTIFSTSGDGSFREWDTNTGNEKRRLNEPPDWYTPGLAVSADGKSIAIAGGGRETPQSRENLCRVRVLDSQTLKERFRVIVPSAWGFDVDMSPDGRYLATAFSWSPLQPALVRVWDTLTAKEIALGLGSQREVACVGFLSDGKTLAAAGSGAGYMQGLRLWDGPSGAEHAVTKGASGSLIGLTFSPTNKVLASITPDGATQLWDITNGNLLHEQHHPYKRTHHCTFSPDGKRVLFSTDDSGGSEPYFPACLWDIAAGKCVRDFHSIFGPAAFAPDGQSFVAADNENNVRLWDASSGVVLRKFQGHTREIYSVAISSDGRHLASFSKDESVRIWNVETGRCILTVPRPLRLLGEVHLQFSPRGSLLVEKYLLRNGGRYEGTINVYEVASGQRLYELDEREIARGPMKFGPDGATMYLPMVNGTFRTIDLYSGATVASVDCGTPFCAFDLSPNGKMLALGYWDGRVSLFECPK